MKNALSIAAAVMGLVGALSTNPTPAMSQSTEYNRQLDVQLRQSRQSYLPAGQTLVRGPLGGSLNEGNSVTYSFNFVAGRSYTVLGVCDNDCSDLDITLYDPQGNEVAEDVLTDDKPVASHRATRTGRYRAVLNMASCSTGSCFFAVAAYGTNGKR